MEDVTTINSQQHIVHVWDFHKCHIHDVKYLSYNFESCGKNSPGDKKRNINIFILKEDRFL